MKEYTIMGSGIIKKFRLEMTEHEKLSAVNSVLDHATFKIIECFDEDWNRIASLDFTNHQDLITEYVIECLENYIDKYNCKIRNGKYQGYDNVKPRPVTVKPEEQKFRSLFE